MAAAVPVAAAAGGSALKALMTNPQVVSALISALGGVAGGLFGSGKPKIKKKTNYTPGQSKLLEQILSQVQGMQGEGGAYGQATDILQQYLDPESDIYKNFEKPYLDEFEQQTVPMLAERFAGKGALSSSGFGQSLSSAGANLQTNLAQMKSNKQRESIQDILGMYQFLTSQGLGAQPFSYIAT